MSNLEMIYHHHIVQMEAELEKCRQVQNELVAQLTKANKTIAEMQKARTEREDRWAYLLGEKCTEATLAAKERDNALAQIAILRDQALAATVGATPEEIEELHAHLEKLTADETQTKTQP